MNRRPLVSLRLLGDLLLIAGGILLAYPLWSSAYAQVEQRRLDASYRQDVVRYERALVAPTDTAIPQEAVVRDLANKFARRTAKGATIGRLEIPRLRFASVVQQGGRSDSTLDPDDDRALLRRGPVHYAATPLPGAGEPFAVAGHRTTYGAPFAHLDQLRPGDVITFNAPYASFRYRVKKSTVVLPTNVGVLLDRGYDLVLTTCTPPHSASHRLIIWAVLERTAVRGAPAR